MLGQEVTLSMVTHKNDYILFEGRKLHKRSESTQKVVGRWNCFSAVMERGLVLS